MCDHSKFHIGSGGYYIICTDCGVKWVAIHPGNDTDLDRQRRVKDLRGREIKDPESESLKQRFVIVNDESGHSYYIPAEKQEHWNEWLYSEEWEGGNVPDYAGYIDGQFSFTDPKTDCD